MTEIPVFMLSRKSAKFRRATAVVGANTGQARTEREAKMIESLSPPIGQDAPRPVRNDPPTGQVEAPTRSANYPQKVS